MRVSLVATKFRGRASAWWQQFKASLSHSGKPRLCSRDKLNKHMRHTFLPYNYEQTLYNKLQNLRQGSRTVVEYATDFFQLLARASLMESEDQLVSIFLGGLRIQLKVPLQQFNPTSVSEAYQCAVSTELQLRPQFQNTATRNRFIPAPDLSSPATNDSTTITRQSVSRPAVVSEIRNNSRPSRPNALRCYSCGEPGHRQTACPNSTRRGLVIQDIDSDQGPKYDDYGDSDPPNDNVENAFGDEGQLLVLRRNCFLPWAPDESWIRSNLFHSMCTINEKICHLIIDSGSCANIISAEAVHKLSLKTEPHPFPYSQVWISTGSTIRIAQQALVTFSIGKTYKDTIHCDVVQMDVGHLLLGRPWQYDQDTTHRGRDKTYMFIFANRTITLYPSPEKSHTISVRPNQPYVLASSSAQPLLLLSKADFEEQVRDLEIIYALVSRPTTSESDSPPPKEFSAVLEMMFFRKIFL